MGHTYLKSEHPMYWFCSLFSVVPSTVQVWLEFSLEIPLRIVRQRYTTSFEIRWPNHSEMEMSAKLLCDNRRHGALLRVVSGVTDGGRLRCAKYIHKALQNAFREGFTQADEVNYLLVWNFLGELIHTAINFPRSWHDSRVAASSGLYYPRFAVEMSPGYGILADSAFPLAAKHIKAKLSARGKQTSGESGKGIPKSVFLSAVERIVDQAMPNENQAAEWDVNAIKRPFSRLSTKIPADSYRRCRILTIVAHLYNYRVRNVGLNQLKTVYARTASVAQPWIA